MKILELFSGTRSIGKAFEKNGHEVYSVDWEKKFQANLYIDIEYLTIDMIIEKFGIPDVLWASPDCTTYSMAGIFHHRGENYSPKSEYAFKSDKINKHLWYELIDGLLKINPKMLYYVENPMGTYRKMYWVQQRGRYTVTYCQYGDKRMKPTDIFTNHFNPEFRPRCHNGDSCHVSAPRGSTTGTQGMKKIDKSRIPDRLCEHIVHISEEYYKEENGVDESGSESK